MPWSKKKNALLFRRGETQDATEINMMNPNRPENGILRQEKEGKHAYIYKQGEKMYVFECVDEVPSILKFYLEFMKTVPNALLCTEILLELEDDPSQTTYRVVPCSEEFAGWFGMIPLKEDEDSGDEESGDGNE